MLAVYVLSEDPSEINNDNIELYFDDQKLRLGINREHYDWESIFDFSGYHIKEGSWFFLRY